MGNQPHGPGEGSTLQPLPLPNHGQPPTHLHALQLRDALLQLFVASQVGSIKAGARVRLRSRRHSSSCRRWGCGWDWRGSGDCRRRGRSLLGSWGRRGGG
jgi:hypothetical protein